MKKQFTFLLAAFLFISPVLAQKQLVAAQVRAVHDGDSWKVRWPDGSVEWLRERGIDAPEVASPYVSITQPYGIESAQTARLALKGRNVLLDTTAGRDRFSRLLVETFLIETSDTLAVGAWLVSSGCAWSFGKNYDAEQAIAKKQKRGLWGQKGRKLSPSTWRSRHRPAVAPPQKFISPIIDGEDGARIRGRGEKL